MSVNIDQWHACFGRFHSCLVILKTKKKKLSHPVIIFNCIFTFFYGVFLSILILKVADIKLNPGPDKNSHSYFSCQWNVNSLATDNYSKVVALKAYNSIYKNNFICHSETFVDSSFESDRNFLLGYSLFQTELPVTPKGVVFVFIIRHLWQYS